MEGRDTRTTGSIYPKLAEWFNDAPIFYSLTSPATIARGSAIPVHRLERDVQ
jgi:hypothetical protein